MNPRRDSKGLEKTRKVPDRYKDRLFHSYLKQLRVIHKGQKKKSTKGHLGRRRATKGLEKTQEGSAKGWEGEKDFHQGR